MGRYYSELKLVWIGGTDDDEMIPGETFNTSFDSLLYIGTCMLVEF